MAADLTAYVPRLLLEWDERYGSSLHQAIDGTLVFADVSGFTALSEKLAQKGKVGAEDMSDIISGLFTDLLGVAGEWGGEMLKFGGDAMLLFFDDRAHEARAARASWEMQRRLRRIGRIGAGRDRVVLRMSVGAASGTVDFFAVGRRHRELLVAGPVTTETVAMEAAAVADEILLSASVANKLPADAVGDERAGGRLLSGPPPTRRRTARAMVGAADPKASLAPVVVRHLESGLDDAEHRVATIVFIHFFGVDGLLENKGADVVGGMLDDLLTEISAILERHNVAFLATDVAGDGGKVMAAAGAPLATGNDEERALRAAREIADLDGAIAIRVGLNNGRIFAGPVGPSFRRTYTAMGDPTNAAARLMGRAEGGQVLTLVSVLGRSRTTFETTAQQPFLAKGKVVPLEPLAVGRPLEGARHVPVTAPDSPLVGRESELALLLEAAKALRSGRGSAMRIVGEPGMGKTRLLDELEQRAPDLRCLQISCAEYDASTPYATSAALVRGVLGVDHEGSLRDAVERVAPHLLPFAPLVGIAARIDMAATPEVEMLDPNAVTQRIKDVVADLIGAAIDGPQIWRIEDVHWCDASSSEVLDELAARQDSIPVSICASSRPGDQGWSFPAGSVIELGALSHAAARRLVEERSRQVSTNEFAAVVERADGNPLFLLSLMEAMSTSDGELPATVEGLMGSRIDRLDPPERTFLRRLAVLGAIVERELAEAVLGEPVDIARFDGLLEGGQDGAIRFSHALVRDAAYEGLPYRRRRETHRMAAEELERRCADVELLSLHFSTGRVHEKAFAYSTTAASRAVERFAYLPAIAFYERAISHLSFVDAARSTKFRTLQDYGDALRKCGRAADARAAFRKARSGLDRADERALRLLLQQGLCSETLGDYRGAVRWYKRALRALDGQQTSVNLAQCLLALGAVRILQGRLRDAESDLEKAFAAASDVQAAREAAHALQLLHAVAISLGKPNSRELGEVALAAARAAGDKHRVAAVLSNLGADAYYSAAWADAEMFYEEAATLNLEIGALLEGAAVEGNLGELYLETGELDRAKITLERALRSLRRLGSPRAALVQLTLARVAVASKDTDLALAHLDEAETTLSNAGAQVRVREVQVRRAEALAALGLPGVLESLPSPADIPAPLKDLADRLRTAAEGGSAPS